MDAVQSTQLEVIGLAEYGDASGNNQVVVKLEARGGEDLWVSFNRAVGINAGTIERQDQVLIHRNTGEGISYIEGTLSSGDTYRQNGYGQNGDALTVRVTDITFGSPAVAFVDIFLGLDTELRKLSGAR